MNCGCVIQSKILLRPVYLTRYFKVAISISKESEHSDFVNT